MCNPRARCSAPKHSPYCFLQWSWKREADLQSCLALEHKDAWLTRPNGVFSLGFTLLPLLHHPRGSHKHRLTAAHLRGGYSVLATQSQTKKKRRVNQHHARILIPQVRCRCVFVRHLFPHGHRREYIRALLIENIGAIPRQCLRQNAIVSKTIVTVRTEPLFSPEPLMLGIEHRRVNWDLNHFSLCRIAG